MQLLKKYCLVLIYITFSYATYATQKTNYALADVVESFVTKVLYVPEYKKIVYPNGDVAANTGVCSDVIIRVYRRLGIDLQVKVYEDMKSDFSAYPSKRK